MFGDVRPGDLLREGDAQGVLRLVIDAGGHGGRGGVRRPRAEGDAAGIALLPAAGIDLEQQGVGLAVHTVAVRLKAEPGGFVQAGQQPLPDLGRVLGAKGHEGPAGAPGKLPELLLGADRGVVHTEGVDRHIGLRQRPLDLLPGDADATVLLQPVRDDEHDLPVLPAGRGGVVQPLGDGRIEAGVLVAAGLFGQKAGQRLGVGAAGGGQLHLFPKGDEGDAVAGAQPLGQGHDLLLGGRQMPGPDGAGGVQHHDVGGGKVRPPLRPGIGQLFAVQVGLGVGRQGAVGPDVDLHPGHPGADLFHREAGQPGRKGLLRRGRAERGQCQPQRRRAGAQPHQQSFWMPQKL